MKVFVDYENFNKEVMVVVKVFEGIDGELIKISM